MADMTPVTQAQQGLESWQASRQNPLSLYNAASAELGLPEVRGRVSTLRKSLLDTENLLSGVEGSVSGRTRGRLVTDAQRSRLVNLERAPITEQYNQIGGQYGMETQNMSDIVGQVGTKSDLAYKGQEQTGDVFKTKLESAKTNYQNQLDAEKEARRQAEADRAYAESVRQYNATLAQSKASAASKAAASGGTMSKQEMIKDAVSRGLGWGDTAKLYEGKYGKIAGGSDADVYLKYYYGLRENNPGKYMSSADIQKASKLGLTSG